jgi:hypothetical protein
MVTDLLAQLTARGITLRPNGDRLRIEAPEGELTDVDMAIITAKKAELLTALSQRDAGLIDRRAAIFRQQIETYWRGLDEDWQKAKHRPIPPISLPGASLRPGACGLCGDPLPPGHPYRCAPCVEAVRVAMEAAR